MEKINATHVLPLDEYNRKRDEIRAKVMQVKAPRRVAIGPYLTLLFENFDTMLYQVQEMIRAESIRSEDGVRHEIETYNQMIPATNELKATLLIEIEDPEVRKFKLRELKGLEEHLSLLIGRDYQIQAEFDEGQADEDKVSSVQFLTFSLGDKAAEALRGTDEAEVLVTHPACSYRVSLRADQIQALREDLDRS